MTLLENLPNELFVQIFSNLPNRDLASASCVSHRLHNISLPLLYREPHLINDRQRPTSLELFLRTLLIPACEYFGTHVRCLTIDWKGSYIQHDTAEPSEIGQVVLLLRFMPHLQALHLPFLDGWRGLPSAHNPLYNLATLPPTLRDFTYEWFTPFDWINIDSFLYLLRLPRIRSIVTHLSPGACLTSAKTDLTAAAAGTSSLTHLTIRDGGGTVIQPLRGILGIPRALTHFAYYAAWVNFDFDFAAFGLAILPLQHSLTSLVLDFRAVYWWDLRHRPPTTIGSLRDWVALRTLTCTLDLLLGRDSRGLAEVLPSGIQELEILVNLQPPLGEAVKVVVALLGVKELVPGLEKVRVYACRRKSKRLRKRLRKACWAVGVALEDDRMCEWSECKSVGRCV